MLHRVIERGKKWRKNGFSNGIGRSARNETSVESNVSCLVGSRARRSRSFLRAITAVLFYAKHPLAVTCTRAHREPRTRSNGRAHERAEALSVSTEEVGRAHAQTRRTAPYRRFVSGIEISGFGNSRCKRLHDRSFPPSRYSPRELNSFN